MLTKNIKFTNFRGNTNSSNKKKLAKILKNKNLVIEIPLLKSLSKDYQLSYSKKLVSSLKKFKKINLIGMGGSILGTQAIYDFLKDKITKKINFFDNLQSREFNTNKEKNINIFSSPLLARALYFTGKIGKEISEDLYASVAAILAYIFKIEKGEFLERPEIEIPSDLQFDEYGNKKVEDVG